LFVHLHALVTDGAFADDDGAPRWFAAPSLAAVDDRRPALRRDVCPRHPHGILTASVEFESVEMPVTTFADRYFSATISLLKGSGQSFTAAPKAA